MIYDPNNELTDKELEMLSEDDFLEYLDSKTEYLSQFIKPLSSYHTKRFASISEATQGREITTKKLKVAADIGRKNETEAFEKIKERFDEIEKDNMEPD